MSDPIDTAQATAELINELAINRHRDALRLQHQMIGTAECVECGEEIPASRRAALPYTTRCVDCQSMAEHRGKHGAAG